MLATPKTSRMATRPVSKELKLFEALECLTTEDGIDASASFIQKFVNCDLDLNNTQQSVITEDDNASCASKGSDKNCTIGDKHVKGKTKSVSFCEEREEFAIVDVSSEEEEEEESDEEEEEEDIEDEEIEEEEDVEQSFSSCTNESAHQSEDEEDMEQVGNEELSNSKENMLQPDEDEINHLIQNAVMKKHGTEFLLLAEIKRALELKESQLERERENFTEKHKLEQKKLTAEIQRAENQRKSFQRLITDYHKLKSTRDEDEAKMKDLMEKLRETKLEMSKRITRWGDQQRKLEERVKNLEKENTELKKQKSNSHRPAPLKRPPMRLYAAQNCMEKVNQSRKIHFADEKQCNASESVAKQSSENFQCAGGSQPRSVQSKLNNRNTSSSIRQQPINQDAKAKGRISQSLPHPSDQSKSDYPRKVSLSDEEADQTMTADYVEMKHPCGTITRATKENKHVRHLMSNGDVMDEYEDGSVRYYYRDLQFSQTTYPNGDEIVEYDSGAVQTTRANGSKIYTFPDGLVKYVDAVGEEEVCFSDGSVMRKSSNGECTVTWPSGQKEVRTSTYVKRFYPNGTVKIMYSDGSEETRYWNGRVRRKDKNGVLVDDTKPKRKSKKKKNGLHSTI